MSKLGQLLTVVTLVLSTLWVGVARAQTGGSASAPSSAVVAQDQSVSPTPSVSPKAASSGSPTASLALSGSPTPTPPSPPPSGNKGASGEHPYLLFLYVLVIVLLVSALHIVDSVQAYELVKRDTRQAFKRLPAQMSKDDMIQVLAALPKPSGVSGTTRSILTYALIIIVGIAIFHLLAVPAPNSANEYAQYADRLLQLIAGSLTTAVGFYFGTKATTEGVEAAGQDDGTPPPPTGNIDNLNPATGPAGTPVVINGTGFGKNRGNVTFGAAAVPAQITNWSETAISVIVPQGLPQGSVDVFVNPVHGNLIVGKGLFTMT